MLMKSYIRTKVSKHIRLLLIKNKCEVCGETKGLELHHVQSFSDLFRECHDKLNTTLRKGKEDYTDTEIENIVNWMLGVHLKTQCLTLCKNCHKQLHNELGGFVKYGNGYEQWIQKNKLLIKAKQDKYIKEIIIPYLDSLIGKKLFKEDQKELKLIFKEHGLNARTMGINTLNGNLKDRKLPYMIVSKMTSKIINDQKRNIRYWEVIDKIDINT